MADISGGGRRADVATLKSDMERERAEIALLVTLRPPTAPMMREAAEAGFYEPQGLTAARFPRVQILTMEDLLAGARRPEYPRYAPQTTFRRAPRKRAPTAKQGELNGG